MTSNFYLGGEIVTGETVTHTYSYDDADWADLLTAYDGHSLTYDAIGNPLTYYNGSSYSMTWAKGRRLASVSRGSSSASYAYDMDGIRTSKTVNGVTTEFITQNGRVVRQSWSGNVLDFFYDSQQRPYAVTYKPADGAAATYYYITNLQGDVVALIDSSGSLAAEYTYNAWGASLTMPYGGAGAGAVWPPIAELNPLRYRGYYYDAETGFYYVSSRYYDPEIGRFINADDIAYLGMGGLTSCNLFAYCGNNPVMGYDPYGTFDWSSFGKGAGWLAIGITAICVGVSVLTCGVAAPAMMAVAAVTVTAGALTAVNGVSELGEAATGHNFVRDDVFRGNEKAYDVYSNTTAAVAEIGTAICGGWTAKNAPRIKAYNNIQNYNYTDTISDVTHMSRPYANSVLTQKQVIKYGKMTKDSFGYVFSAMGSVNGKEKLWRLGINTAKGLVWHWGHGF